MQLGATGSLCRSQPRGIDIAYSVGAQKAPQESVNTRRTFLSKCAPLASLVKLLLF